MEFFYTCSTLFYTSTLLRFRINFLTLLISNGLSFQILSWHARCIILVERRNEPTSSSKVQLINNNIHNKKITHMKKLFFAAFAAFVMVSVSNVFANNSMSSLSTALPQDTTTVDTVAPAEQPAEQPAETPAETPTQTEDSTVSATGADDTAMMMFSDSTEVDTTKSDVTPDVA